MPSLQNFLPFNNSSTPPHACKSELNRFLYAFLCLSHTLFFFLFFSFIFSSHGLLSPSNQSIKDDACNAFDKINQSRPITSLYQSTSILILFPTSIFFLFTPHSSTKSILMPFALFSSIRPRLIKIPKCSNHSCQYRFNWIESRWIRF